MARHYNAPMSVGSCNLAIETTSRQGSLALGRGDALLDTMDLPAQRRHHVGLVPGMDALCRAHGHGPADVAEIYVSLGPGSFTGLRVAIAAVKMLALARSVKVVGVPTLAVLARQAPVAQGHVAPCLSLKRGQVYCGVYRRASEACEEVLPPALRTLEDLLRDAPRPVALLGEMLPDLPVDLDAQVTVLPGEAARPRCESVWQLGRIMARSGEYTDPLTLEPLYVRRPEAVELWAQRQKVQAG